MMAIDLEERLKNYAKGHLDWVQDEYDAQIQKWVMYTNVVADAQIAAFDRHKNVLKKIEQERTANAQFAMLALSFVGGFALSWIHVHLEHKLYPSIRGRYGLVDSFADGGYQLKGGYTGYNAATADLFGGSMAHVAGVLMDGAFSQLLNKDAVYSESPALTGAMLTGNIGTYKTQLQNAIHAQRLTMVTMFGDVSRAMNQDRAFGAKLLKIVEASRPCRTDQDREILGKQLLDDYFDRLREQYAKEWFYYGNDPDVSKLTYLSMHLQKEIWALWILAQDFKMVALTPDLKYPFGKDKFPISVHVLRDLVQELGETQLHDLEYAADKQLSGRILVEEAHLNKLLQWARSHPAKRLAGRVDYRPRILRPIRLGHEEF